MTCRHGPNNPDCSSYRASAPIVIDNSPDPSQYNIKKFERVGPHIIVLAEYPNCKKCSFEGLKVMVFLNVSEADVIMWRKIDPHFRSEPPKLTEAPSPSARFPATDQGWADAIAYATSKRTT